MDNEISSKTPCPCGSGKPYGSCCKKKNFKYIIENNEIIKQIPLHEEIIPLLQEEKKKFKQYYGREPSDSDFLFAFAPIYGNDIVLNTVYFFRQEGVPEREIYAYYKSDGLLPCNTNIDLLPEKEIQEYKTLCNEFDKAMEPTQEQSINAVKFVLLTNSIIEDTSYYVIDAVIDTLNDYIHRHNESETTPEYQMETEKDYCLFSALKTIKTLQSIKQLIDAHLTECIYALGRGVFENYLYLCSVNSDPSFFNEFLLPKVDRENYSFARRADGGINYKRVIKNETGEERSIKVNIADLVERLPYDTDKELYRTFYTTACQYVHVDVMSAQSYFSECDPYDEIDRALIASLIVGLLSVFLLLRIASNNTTLKQYKEDVNHLCQNELFPKISMCLSAANSDPEHKNDIYDLLLRRISEEKSR
ncbi:MAG: SEC-C domain-containing protein [Clostridia bacterium]|nr:SEC-C domain-containing protein [Clostridia bacterium]